MLSRLNLTASCLSAHKAALEISDKLRRCLHWSEQVTNLLACEKAMIGAAGGVGGAGGDEDGAKRKRGER